MNPDILSQLLYMTIGAMLTLAGSITTAVIYDRLERRRLRDIWTREDRRRDQEAVWKLQRELDLRGTRTKKQEEKSPPGITGHSKPVLVVGDIKAGYPGLLAEEDNVDDWVVVDERLARDAEFGLQVREDSMIGAGILPGDRVFIRPQITDIKPKEIAAVHIVTTGGEDVGTLTHVEWRDTHWYLTAENSGILPRVVAPTNTDVQRIAAEYKTRGEDVEPIEGTVEVVGKVVAVMRSLS